MAVFIKNSDNIIITGPTGAGKSFIVSALGHQACHRGYKAFYSNAGKLFSKLKSSKVDGSYLKEIKIASQLPIKAWHEIVGESKYTLLIA